MHQEETTMENPDQAQETQHVEKKNEPKTNPVQDARVKRPVAMIQYPPTPPAIKETEASIRTVIRPINLEEDSGDHSDDDEFHDSITQVEPEDDKLSGTESAIDTKARPKNLDRELKNLQSINPPGSSEFAQRTSGTCVHLPA